MTANDLWTSFSIRLSRRVSRRMVGLGMRDSLAFAALVLAAGGALSCAVALVRDLVLRAGAVGLFVAAFIEALFEQFVG